MDGNEESVEARAAEAMLDALEPLLRQRAADMSYTMTAETWRNHRDKNPDIWARDWPIMLTAARAALSQQTIEPGDVRERVEELARRWFSAPSRAARTPSVNQDGVRAALAFYRDGFNDDGSPTDALIDDGGATALAALHPHLTLSTPDTAAIEAAAIERCAKVAEEWGGTYNRGPVANARKSIATAIRALKPEDRP